MHDEDGDLGLHVQNPAGDRWKIYGDMKLFDPVNSENLRMCTKAIQVSVQEVYDAYRSGKVVDESKFGAWTLAPILELISSDPENHSPLLFVKSDGRIYKRDSTSVQGVLVDKYDDYVMIVLENWKRLEKQVQMQIKRIVGSNLGFLMSAFSGDYISH